MTAGLDCACTLVSAPAGWGKTLLTSSWLGEGGAGRAAAWISLEPAEDHLRAFWTAVATALAPIVGDPAAAALQRIAVDEDAEHLPGRIAAVLTEDATPVLLVLDNLQEISSSAVHESVLRLIRRPPAGMRLVATTRRDPPWPLHRLRLAGMLTEIRVPDLAFRADETAELFARLRIDVDGIRLDRLVERTEGWAAGLRLAALHLQSDEDPGFIEAFSGDDHAVAAYLLTEVIDAESPELVDFLVRVSFLDLVSADLADTVTGGSSGAATLAALASSNLFVQAVGPDGQWYRLHRLIRDVLRPRVSDPRTLRDIHRRAAEWHRRQSLPLDAVRYALRGGLWAVAADLAGVYVVALVLRGSAPELDVLLSAVPRDVLLRHPELAVGLAAARTAQGANVEVGELLAAARSGADDLARTRAERLRLVLAVIEMTYARSRGDLAAVAAAASSISHDPYTLADLGLASWDVLPIVLLSNAGTAELWIGDGLEAEKHLRAAIGAVHSSVVLRPQLNARAHLALLHALRGNLPSAQEDAQEVVAQATRAGLLTAPQTVAAYLALAWVALDQDDPAGVDRWLARVGGIESIAPEPHIQLAAAGLNALRHADTGALEGALTGLRAATDRLAATAPSLLADRLRLVEAELLRRAGDLSQAGDVLTRLRDAPTAATVNALARLQLAAGDVTAAEQALAAFPQEPATARERVDGAVLRTLIAATHDREAALRSLEDALVTAARLEIRRPFLLESTVLRTLLDELIDAGAGDVAFAVDLLRRMSRQHDRPTLRATLVDALTEREDVVLRYLASTLSNPEIAAELYLSINTLKTHERMIYRKLGADGRRDAVGRAKALRIL
jgi:LuxR family maltose regulon positive regulatory protein